MKAGILRAFLLKWVIPPGFVEARRRRLIPALQKFWTGSPVLAPRYESAYFQSVRLASQTVTRHDDSRTCARMVGAARLPLPTGSGGEAVQFAIVADRDWQPQAQFTVKVGSRTVSHVGLASNQWLDIRVDVPPDAAHLEITSEKPAYVSFPRAVRVNSTVPDSLRHVIVLVLDGWTTRLSAVTHPTEPKVPLTPNIDRFFADGFEASNGYSSGEWTMPTAASFFTGLCTGRHQMFHPYKPAQLPAERTLLAERFQAEGFHTLCMSTANRLTPAYGHHRGFDRFIYHFPEPGFTTRAYDPAVWLAELTGHLDTHRCAQTFSYVHLPDTHPPWHVAPLSRAFNLQRRGDSTGLHLQWLTDVPNAAEQGRQLYLLRLHEIDRMLGGLFDFIERNLRDHTLVVLTADHGTPWHHLRPRRPADEPYLVDDRTAISLQMRGPGVPHRRYDGLTSPNLDLMPTLLARAGLSIPDDLDGRDLLSPSYRRDHVVSESLYKGVYEIAVRDGKRTYVEKYKLDEERVQIAGAPVYQGLFPYGTSDFTHFLAEPPGPLADIARTHIKDVGLLGV